MTISGPLERVDALLASEIDAIRPELAASPVAVGWATVELERAAAELGAALGIGVERFEVAPDTTVLGARCLIARDVLAGARSLVLLEPSTEGRLAATLARFGEGPAAIWMTPVDPIVAPTTLDGAGRALPAATAGPLGPERLLPGRSGYGPHRLLIEPAGTIRA